MLWGNGGPTRVVWPTTRLSCGDTAARKHDALMLKRWAEDDRDDDEAGWETTRARIRIAFSER